MRILNSLGVKIYAAAAISLIAMLIVSIYAIYQIGNIGIELKAITEEDIPLTIEITEAATDQLEQTITFERILKYALEKELGLADAKKYEAAKTHFFELGEKVENEIIAAEKIAAHGQIAVSNPDAIAEFADILTHLKVIEKEHKVFESHVKDVIKLLDKGDLKKGIPLGEKVDLEAEHLDKEIKSVLVQISKFTEKSVLLAEQHEKEALYWLSVICFILLITVPVIVFFIVQKLILTPLSTSLSAVNQLTANQLDKEIPTNRHDEIGSILKGLEIFRLKLLENRSLEEEMQELNKTSLLRSDKIDQLNITFDDNVTSILTKVNAATHALNETAHNMSAASEQTQRQSSTVLDNTSRTSSTATSVSSAVEELSATTGAIKDQTSSASNMTTEAVENFSAVRSKTAELVSNANKINEVIELIAGIAEQTNLLALNATIEAARAGEAGRGFAVVASEVKALATQTSKATEEISARISTMQNVTDTTALSIETIIEQVEGVNEAIIHIDQSVEEQSCVISDVNQNILTVSSDASETEHNIKDINDSAIITGNSAHSVLNAVNELNAEADMLQAEISEFLNEVKSA